MIFEPDFMKIQTNIKTNRLILRAPNESDWNMVSYLRTDLIVNQYVNRPTAETKEKALAFVSRMKNEITTGKICYWIVAGYDNPKMKGSICLWNFSEDLKQAELGYDLSPEYQGQGIMNESVIAVLDFGRDILKLDKILAYTHRNNEPSKNLLLRNNFKLLPEMVDAGNKDNIVFEIRFDRS